MAEPRTEPLSEHVGARVEGIDAERLLTDHQLPSWTLTQLERFGVLAFPGLGLDDEAQAGFSRRLGTVKVVGSGHPPEIFRVTLDPAKNPLADYLRGTFDWHIDGCTDDIPIMATLLSAHAVAESGGETEFASSYVAYEHLDPSEKDGVETLRVVHSLEASQRLVNDEPVPQELAVWRRRPAKVHPLVWRHRSGRRSLVIGATTDHIRGMARDRSRALLDHLLERATAPELTYRHRWRVGDLVFWDNRGVLHRARRYDDRSPRDMHRTTLAGDEPIQ